MPKTIMMTDDQILQDLKATYGPEITSGDIRGYCAMKDISYPTVTRRLEKFKTGHGKWNLEITPQEVEKIENAYIAPAAIPAIEQNLIPEKDDNFVNFGNFLDIKKVISTRLFYPTFITGLSGNGKTFCVEQACAQLKRELIRVNITIETDEDDLIGGFRLIDGDTVWHNGPVIEALQRGAVLLLDEIDLASNKILCLQSILEGKGVFLKKIGKFIQPKPGFTIIATANTKGKGSDDGRFIGTNVLNEAFLERFYITLEQKYPQTAIELKILEKVCSSLNIEDCSEFCNYLVRWADNIRKTFYDGGIEEVISTRRLVHIIRTYAIFKNKDKAIRHCINRFDEITKQSFMNLYNAVDGTGESEEFKESNSSNVVDEDESV
jgi:hypothetical protein